MEGRLLTFLLFVGAASSAVALKCHVCAAGGVCNGDEVGEVKSCQIIPGLVADQCTKFDGGISGNIAGTPISFTGVIRGCNHHPAGVAPPLGCFSGSEATAQFRGIVKDLVPSGTTVSDDLLGITITGDVCYCADGDGCNGVDSLKPFLWLILTVGLMHSLLM